MQKQPKKEMASKGLTYLMVAMLPFQKKVTILGLILIGRKNKQRINYTENASWLEVVTNILMAVLTILFLTAKENGMVT